MTLGDLIKNFRSSHGMSQDDFADYSGLSKAYISILERNFNPSTRRPAIPSLETIKSVSSVIGMDFNDVIAVLDGTQKVSLAKSPDEVPKIPTAINTIPLPEMKAIPLVGKIACGAPITATENLEGYIKIPAQLEADFALVCRGDSMVGARIMDGDFVAIRQQPDVDDGEIAAVLIEDEATLKRVYKMPGRLVLRAENPRYAPIDLSGAELDGVRILGKAVYFISSIK